jgi:PAS domain S-box-containing protein
MARVEHRPIRLPELIELHTFVLAVEHGSVSGAAQRLLISPTAATKRLNNLESLAGAKLLERTSRGVKTTALGRRLLPKARQLLRDAQTLLPSLADEDVQQLGGVRRAIERASDRPSSDDLLEDVTTLLAQVFGTTSEPFLVIDSERRVIDVNDAYCRVTGYRREQVAGFTIADLDLFLHDRDATPHRWFAQPSEASETAFRGLLRVHNGEPRSALYSVLPIEIARQRFVLVRLSDIRRPSDMSRSIQIDGRADPPPAAHPHLMRRHGGVIDTERQREECDS